MSEQIGPLIFVENPDYPYPFNVPRPPRFWMNETTGRLADAVETYLRNDELTAEQMEILKIYLRQYIERAVIADTADRRKLLEQVETLRRVGDVERFADALSEAGLEPF
ncbi:MAG: hypothetical protein RMK84_00805 [Oscillochloridaceae bacterium]|nr:hypothetical protein [Chloroflexaceae bacterium]MDW8388636.1 hypothetical protein [Oscillochloridaceae bacterium]